MFAMSSCFSSISSLLGFGPAYLGIVSQKEFDDTVVHHVQFDEKEEQVQPMLLVNGGSNDMTDSEFIANRFKNGGTSAEGAATLIPHIGANGSAAIKTVGNTRVEVRVNNPDGSDTLLASVDSGDLQTEEKSLEQKILEAVSANSGSVVSSPIANALANAKKNNH